MGSLNQNRLGHIDSIRGIAAFMVLFQHVTESFVGIPDVGRHGTLLYEVPNILSLGTIGVIAFFAISGFVICPSIKGERRSGARRFVISRFFRLYPAFWAAIFFSVLSGFLLVGEVVDWKQVAGNMVMLYSLAGVQPLEGLFWTLEVELVFYILCLTLFFCGQLHKPHVLFFTGLFLLAVGEFLQNRPEYKLGILNALGFHWPNMPKYLAIMFWGGLFRAWYDNRQGVCLIGGYTVPTIVLVIVLIFLMVVRYLIIADSWLYKGDLYKMAEILPVVLGLGLFIVGALYVRLENRFLVRLGVISYSIYLLHPPVFITVRHFVVNEGLLPRDMHLSFYLLICAVLTIFLSELVYRLVEKPAIDIGHKISGRKSSYPGAKSLEEGTSAN